MTKRKITAALLCAVMLFSVAACTDKTGGDTQTTANVSETAAETELTAILPDVNYDGKYFNIMIDGGTIANMDFIAEKQTGEILNDAVFARNRTVEERFNMIIKSEVIGYGGTFVDGLNTYITAGDNSFHAAMGMNNIASGITSLIYSGKFIDWNELAYCNLDMPWWDQNVIRDLAFGDKI